MKLSLVNEIKQISITYSNQIALNTPPIILDQIDLQIEWSMNDVSIKGAELQIFGAQKFYGVTANYLYYSGNTELYHV